MLHSPHTFLLTQLKGAKDAKITKPYLQLLSALLLNRAIPALPTGIMKNIGILDIINYRLCTKNEDHRVNSMKEKS